MLNIDNVLEAPLFLLPFDQNINPVLELQDKLILTKFKLTMGNELPSAIQLQTKLIFVLILLSFLDLKANVTRQGGWPLSSQAINMSRLWAWGHLLIWGRLGC